MGKAKVDKKVTFRLTEQEREQYKQILKQNNTNIQFDLRSYILFVINLHEGGTNGN